MVTGCLRAFSSEKAKGRAIRSDTPPGGNGTMICTGLDGYGSCALEIPGTSPVTTAQITNITGKNPILFIIIPPFWV
jgi:hypothetical protein